MALIVAAVERLEVKVEAHSQQIGMILALLNQTAPAPDRDGQVVSAIAATFGASVFSALDLLEAQGELHDLLQGMSARTLGAWLRRLRGKSIGGFRLQRVGKDADGSIWELTISR